MSDYKETTLSGKSWQQARRVVIDNPYGGRPSATSQEEMIINLEDQKIYQPIINSLTVYFDSENNLHKAIYDNLNAIYIEAREQRDASIPNAEMNL